MQNIANLKGVDDEIMLISVEIIIFFLKKIFSVYKCLLSGRVNIYLGLDQS